MVLGFSSESKETYSLPGLLVSLCDSLTYIFNCINPPAAAVIELDFKQIQFVRAASEPSH